MLKSRQLEKANPILFSPSGVSHSHRMEEVAIEDAWAKTWEEPSSAFSTSLGRAIVWDHQDEQVTVEARKMLANVEE